MEGAFNPWNQVREAARRREVHHRVVTGVVALVAWGVFPPTSSAAGISERVAPLHMETQEVPDEAVDQAVETADLSLGEVGQWHLSPGWAVHPDGSVILEARVDAVDSGGLETERQGVSQALEHTSGASVLVLALPRSQSLSLLGVCNALVSGTGEPALERHGDYWWWRVEGDGLAAFATGIGGKSVFVLMSGAASLAPDELDAFLAGLEMNRETVRIDETWIAFDLPTDVVYVHRDASPFSWTRGDGIVAVDVTFDKPQDPEHPYRTSEELASLQQDLEGWTLIQGMVQLHVKGLMALEQASQQIQEAQTGEPPREALKALIAAPGSVIGAPGIAFIRREGTLKVELRAEGRDAPLLARNDLLAMARTLEIKPRYDWWYDSRKMKHKVNPEFAQQVLEEAMPSLVALADLTAEGLNKGWNTPLANGLTVVQQLPVVGFSLIEVGRARTPTEESVAVNFGYLPQAHFVIRDYFDSPGDNFGSWVSGVGASISSGTRLFRQRGEAVANWQVFWDQEGTPLTDEDGLLETYDFGVSSSYPVQGGKYVPLWVKMRAGYNIDPTTWLIPHRLGGFGDWRLGIGLGMNVDIGNADYVDPNGEKQEIFFYNTAFTPTLGFHTRLFWGALHIAAQAYWVPSQLGLVNIFRDSAVESEVALMAEAGELPDIQELFTTAGISGLFNTLIGTGRFDGARGLYATAVLGFPMGAPGGTLHPPIKWGIVKDAGPLPPLGAKKNRFAAITTLGIGITVFFEQTYYMPFTTAWNPDGPQQRFSTINKGFIIGLGNGATYLPSFGSGPR